MFVGVVLLGVASVASPVHAAPPPEFGNDWDDPQIAAPAVEKPSGPSCTVRIVDNRFASFDPYRAEFTPPAACPGPWAKVVLTLTGAVAGRQFDRLGRLEIGGVNVFKTSTPEPSVDGIRWKIEKDITEYGAVLANAQPVTMWLNNVVDDVFTGILDVQVDLTFYPGKPTLDLADDVFAVGSGGAVTVARNTERLIAEIYVTGSGGGCEEFWYITAPPSTGYSCTADSGPYREVQILVDGRVAGIAAPYPHIYTGGWSNPFLWYTVPAPRAFNLTPVRYDLSPFVGGLTDGQPHQITVNVLGVPAGQSGWETPTNLLAWRDPGATRVTGQLLTSALSPLVNEVAASQAEGWTQVAVRGGHRFSALGYVQTSHGRVTYAVNRELANTSTHRWRDGEDPDSLTATWTDTSTALTAGLRPRLTHHSARYTIDGVISVDEGTSLGDRLTTTITATDAATHSETGNGGPQRWTLEDTYTGEATWTLGVPRPDRHAVGTSSERYQLRGNHPSRHGKCYDRTIATVNGFITSNRNIC
ncbi:hypothetical protein Rhe02_07000 [Rhizocola hellebori]|uniref:Peptide N-acetyl-beta-D-glucosaminyl asparaginase amidase A N-terminal domain-containing protein n=1 Tax=Rhizocola hellebori TaxID=1392758 RepID=A0A8J3Q3E5_9ACTN|nr:hypothetical protein Rhe02_07000 [Rhizocola hellebori]